VIEAGPGGIVSLARFAGGLSLVALLSLSFMLTGHVLCAKTRLFGAREFEVQDAGVCYFAGMALFLVLFNSIGMVYGRAFAPLIVVLVVFAAVSLYAIAAGRMGRRAWAWVAGHAGAIGLWLPVAAAALLVLHYIVTKRFEPTYDEIARDIVTRNRIPALNRHYGQSLLASACLLLTGASSRETFVAESIACLNHWLFVSQIAMSFVLFRVLRALKVSRAGVWFGVVILMFGNSALSLLPYILYDHDYPLVMNIYPDSLFGLAGMLVIVLFLADACRSRPGAPLRRVSVWPSIAVPALIAVVLHITAELNVVVMGAMLGAVALVAVWFPWGDQIEMRPLLQTGLILAFAAVVGVAQGGSFSTALASEFRKNDSPYWARQASDSKLTVTHARWWYVPSIVPGLPMGFGNLPVATAVSAGAGVSPTDPRLIKDPVNQAFIAQFLREPETPSRYRVVLYAVEVRALQALRTLWFPLLGLAAFGALLIADDRPDITRRAFWVSASAAFVVAFAVVFLTNSTDGDAVFWKWALTRLFEPGLCLGMLAFVVVADRGASRIASPKLYYAAWLTLTFLMSFGTLLRIFFYPNFDGA